MTPSWRKLVNTVVRWPGVGPKMAERLALHFLRHPAETQDFMNAMTDARKNLKRCPLCGDFVEAPGQPAAPCPRCQDPSRASDSLCVVEEVGDLVALERSRAYQGGYHVLGGVLSALDGVGPKDLRIDLLLERVREKNVREVILAMNPTAEGETTATYLADLLKPHGAAVTRLAYGLPAGSAIQYADEFTLAQALEGRRTF